MRPLREAGIRSALLVAILTTLVRAQVTPNDPSFRMQWALNNTDNGNPNAADINAPEAWAIHSGTDSVLVAIVGHGVGPHTELVERLMPGFSTVGDPYDTADSCSFGTHAAGIIGATRGNGLGIAGLADRARLLPVRVLENCAVTPVFQVRGATARGIEWAVDQGADIVLVLLAFASGDQALADAVSYAAANDVLVIAPAGEGGNNEIGFPAAYAECMAVSATTRMDEPWADSNYGVEVDVAAPGEDILSTWRELEYEYRSSTGSAAALVAGTAALVLSYAPHLTSTDVRRILVDSADDLGASGWPAPYNVGRLNAERALQLASEQYAPALRFEHVEMFPTVLVPGDLTSFQVRVVGVGENLMDGSVSLLYRTSPSWSDSVPGISLGGGLFRMELPPMPCDAVVDYWLSATGDGQTQVSDPLAAPSSWYTARATSEELVFADDFEGPGQWTTVTEGGSGTKGAWTRVDPVGTAAQPDFDFSPGTARKCYVTGQHVAGGHDWDNDVDGGPVRLISPAITLDAPDAIISYACWFYSENGVPDELTVEVSRDDGSSWELIETVGTTGGWEEHTFRLSEVSGGSGNQLRLRFSTEDTPAPGDSLTEAAIDEVRVTAIKCAAAKGDFDGDGDMDLHDFRHMAACLAVPSASSAVGAPCSVFDLDDDGDVALDDFQRFQNMFGLPAN